MQTDEQYTAYLMQSKTDSFGSSTTSNVWIEFYAQWNRAYNDLAIWSQMSARDDTGSYAWDVVVHQPYQLELHEMEAKVKLLRLIKRRLDRYQAEWGPPQSFGEYAKRTLKALPQKPTEMIVQIKGHPNEGERLQVGRTTGDNHIKHAVDTAIAMWHRKAQQ